MTARFLDELIIFTTKNPLMRGVNKLNRLIVLFMTLLRWKYSNSSFYTESKVCTIQSCKYY